MKKVLAYKDLDLQGLLNKSYGDDAKLEQAVKDIIEQVRRDGQEALFDLTARFDRVDLRATGLRVSEEEMEAAWRAVTPEILKALTQARDNIYRFHMKQKRVSWMEPLPDGSVLGQLIQPLARVGIYVPGGTAAYPSSALMNAVPAMVAGVGEIVMVSPPRPDGSLLPEVLVAASLCNITEIYKIGGAQAIAALAYGAGDIGKVDKISGPGNIYVTLAKKQVYGQVDIDMLAGPSEILILADDSAEASELAADLLSQAEHDKMASPILISPDRVLLEATIAEVERQLVSLPRGAIARASWETYGAAIEVEDLAQGMELANAIAPEHLELAVHDPYFWLGKVRNAGAIFVGRYTPEPVGDYFAGPNHILPTGGTARFFSVLDVDAFVKKTSVIHYSKQALTRDAAAIMALARREGLEAHARAIFRRTGDALSAKDAKNSPLKKGE